MRYLLLPVAVVTGLLLSIGGSQAQSTGTDTGTVTATCKDGTSFTGAKRSGACRGHGGVQSWDAASQATTIPVNAPAEPVSPPAARGRAAPPPANSGQVWVNTDSHVYHCPGTRWYGKTKQGTYMSETQAQAQGAKPDHGKACAS